MGSYVPGTEQERTEMLREIGFESIEQLFAHIPEEVKVKDGLQIPEGMSEFEVRKTMQKIAQKNKVFPDLLLPDTGYRLSSNFLC